MGYGYSDSFSNTYVAEEILGKPIERDAFVTGRIYPQKGGKKLKPSTRLSKIILINGELVEKLSYSEAVKNLKAGYVVIKGANALDYKNKIAGVYIGSPTGGTTGKFFPYVVAKKAYLIIPIGLEKLIAGDIIELSKKMRSSVESLNKVPSMFSLTGEIVTEIEALKILTRVSSFQAGTGGIGGAEGGVKLILRGSKNQVDNALKTQAQRDQKLQDLRDAREPLLLEADIEINKLIDSSGDYSAWSTYRQALRDITNTYKTDGVANSSCDDLIISGFSWPSKP